VLHDGIRFDVVEVEGSRIGRISVTFERRRDDRDAGISPDDKDELGDLE
jgi:hypothetical protein